PARLLAVSRARAGWRILADRLATRLVVLGGIIVIASILAILLVIAGEVYPLFRKPAATLVGRHAASSTDARGEPAPGDSVGVDEYREIAFRITAGGSLAFTALRGERALPAAAVPGLAGARITAVTTSGASRYLLGTS